MSLKIHGIGASRASRPLWAALELGLQFEHSPIHYQGGATRKPDSKMFHAGAQALGVLPEEVLHIGDDPHLDVLAAQRAGMQSVWINREEKQWAHDTHPAPFTVMGLKELCEAWPV